MVVDILSLGRAVDHTTYFVVSFTATNKFYGGKNIWAQIQMVLIWVKRPTVLVLSTKYYSNILIHGNMMYFCRVIYHCLSSIRKPYTLPMSTIHQHRLENAEHPALTYPMIAGSDPSGLVSSRVIVIGASSSSMIIQPQ